MGEATNKEVCFCAKFECFLGFGLELGESKVKMKLMKMSGKQLAAGPWWPGRRVDGASSRQRNLIICGMVFSLMFTACYSSQGKQLEIAARATTKEDWI